jgi:hypothetical protein
MPVLPPIRTITFGIAEPHPISAPVIERAKTILQQARFRYNEAGYEVQSVRLSTQPIFSNLAGWSIGSMLAYNWQICWVRGFREFCDIKR